MRKSIATNHLGSFSLNHCRKFSIQDATKQIKTVQTKEIMENMFGFPIEIFETPCHFGGKRYWFSCPVCSKRVFILYQDPIAGAIMCRHCVGLSYRKQRFKGMIEERDDWEVES